MTTLPRNHVGCPRLPGDKTIYRFMSSSIVANPKSRIVSLILFTLEALLSRGWGSDSRQLPNL